MSDVQVRGMREEDIAAVVAMDRVTEGAPHWAETVYRDVVREMVANHVAASVGPGVERRCVVAVAPSGGEEKLAGFAGGAVLRTGADGAIGELETVVVARECRRRGVGRALCAALVGWMREAGAVRVELEVRASSAGAIALYRSLGLVDQGRRRRYYSQPTEDAMLMALDLGERASGTR